MAPKKPVQSSVKAAIRAQIDENLKRAYRDILSAEVPDRFRELLSQLQARSAEADAGPFPGSNPDPEEASENRAAGAAGGGRSEGTAEADRQGQGWQERKA